MTDGQLLQPWTLRRGDHVVMSAGVSAVRGFVCGASFITAAR
jgi:hypothetical protein